MVEVRFVGLEKTDVEEVLPLVEEHCAATNIRDAFPGFDKARARVLLDKAASLPLLCDVFAVAAWRRGKPTALCVVMESESLLDPNIVQLSELMLYSSHAGDGARLLRFVENTVKGYEDTEFYGGRKVSLVTSLMHTNAATSDRIGKAYRRWGFRKLETNYIKEL